MDEIFSASVPPLERLSDYFKHVYEGQTKRHGECGSVLGCPYCTLGCEIGTQDRAIGDQVHKILDRNARYFESAIRDAHAQGLISAPDAKAKAQMLVAFFQGMPGPGADRKRHTSRFVAWPRARWSCSVRGQN